MRLHSYNNVTIYILQLEIRYNIALSSSRSVVERCFSLLKMKWRRLKTYLHVLNLSYATDIIIAACCLHNFVRNDDDWNEDWEQDNVDEIEEDESDLSDSDEENEDITAVIKRHSIALYYTPQDEDDEE